jgi:hypothetical protein
MLVPPGPFPVGHDLDPPEACPFPDELQSAGIEAAGEHLPFTETEARLPEW